MTRILSVVTVLLLVCPVVADGQGAGASAKKSTRTRLYDTEADAKEQIKTATAQAQRDTRRVLVVFGYNECGWCHKLHGLFASDKAIRKLLADEYVLVMVDIKSPHADGLLKKSKAALSEDLKKGIGFPFLAVLDGDGKVVTAQRTDPLEVRDHHDPAKVKAFLKRWAAPKGPDSKGQSGKP
jgi:thioredoxin-related protein